MKSFFETMDNRKKMLELHGMSFAEVFYLCEESGGVLDLISRNDALKMIDKFGSFVKLRSSLTLYSYDSTEDEWYPTLLKTGTALELAGPRPDAVPPFQSMQALLKQIGRSDATKLSQFMAHFRIAQKAGKFPWVQEPFEVYSVENGKRGYVSLLELLYALDPDSFQVLEHVLNMSSKKWGLLLVG